MKKADSIITGEVIFIILNIVFFACMFFFVSKSATGEKIYEEMYAKKVALAIENSRPGIEMSIMLDKLYEFADANNIQRKEALKIDSEKNLVIVRLKKGEGIKYQFFSDYEVLWQLDEKIPELSLTINQNLK